MFKLVKLKNGLYIYICLNVSNFPFKTQLNKNIK